MAVQKRIERIELKAAQVVTASEFLQIAQGVVDAARKTVNAEDASAFCSEVNQIVANALRCDVEAVRSILDGENVGSGQRKGDKSYA